MEKKTIGTLRAMVCGEIEDIAKKGTLSHETLDILKDLVETEKNLAKIEKYGEEKEEKEEMRRMGMSMDGGYSQRKYYIDADYQPGAMSYGRGNYDMGNSYGYDNNRNGNYMYAYADGNSNGMGGQSGMYYDPRYEMPMYIRAGQGGQSRGIGYTRTSSKEEIIENLKDMMRDAGDDKVRNAISEVITKIDK